MGITIRKIAKDLKLAVSTVSKALRDSHEISEETKRKVFDHARKLQYVPNPYAGSLKNGTTRNIAVVLPEVADTFFSNAINGIERVAQAKGYHVMVYLTHENCEREASILRELRSGRVDGILISVSGGVKRDSVIHAQVAKELPLIFFDRICDEVPTARVLTDDFEASYKATNHLISKGCRKIVFLAAPGSLSITEQRREWFYEGACRSQYKEWEPSCALVQ
jgi:LacI family transcriptional regulator